MSHELPLGQIHETPQSRDAVHVAVAPVIAAERLVPGGHIGFVGGDTEHVTARAKTLLGVVDPFLTGIVEHGQRFFMFLYPQTITSLRHDWTHPAFEAVAPIAPSDDKAASEAWLRRFCDTADCPRYETIMQAIAGTLEGDPDYGRWGYIDSEYFHFSGWDAHSEIPDEFWKHIEVVTGKSLTVKPRSFSCSC